MTVPDPGPATVDVTVGEGVARLVLNNPRRKNAITLAMAAAIDDFCDLVADDPSIGAVIVDGVGSYFCSGADTRDLAASSTDPASDEAMRRTSAVYGAFVRIGRLPVPSVAVVRGGAVGAGLNLAMATDVMLLTPDAVLDSGFLARRIHPGGGHLSLLGRSLSRQQAVAVGVLGARMDAEEAVRRGLAWAVHEAGSIATAAEELVRLAATDPALARRAMHSADLELGAGAVPWSAAIEVERGVQMWSLRRKGGDGWSARVTP